MSKTAKTTARQFSELQGSKKKNKKKTFYQMLLVQSLWETHILCFFIPFQESSTPASSTAYASSKDKSSAVQ